MFQDFFKKDTTASFSADVIQLNVAVYGSPFGIPARFFAGLIPAVLIARKFSSLKKEVVIRAFDPVRITAYCNGWQDDAVFVQNEKAVHLAESFFREHNIPFFISYSCPVTDEMRIVLSSLADAIKNESTLKEVVEKLEASGSRYGGVLGKERSILYAAAHAFGWQDLWHPSVWLQKPEESKAVINIMGEGEKSFSMIRKFLVDKFPELCLPDVHDLVTMTCGTPHYIPYHGEPLIEVLLQKGFATCLKKYGELFEFVYRDSERTTIKRLIKDFTGVMNFMSHTCEEPLNGHMISFNIRERESLLFLRDIEAKIQVSGQSWIATIPCMELGEYHHDFPLYVTLRGYPFVYDTTRGSVWRVFYKDMGR